jgi:catechol-2,3-dioxygenase
MLMKIKKVELLISNFEQTVQFYEKTLQFKILSADGHCASFQIGESVLELMKDDEEQNYYYHFAFNIPSNLFKEAKEWLSKRVELLKEDGMDEVDFDGITQANACYFDDPAGNIVEYIARRETSPTSNDKEFSTKNVLSISEIGLSTNKITEYAEKIKSLGIPVRGNVELSYDLNFMGEYEDGAFIILGPLGRRWFFSTKVAVHSPVTIHTNRGIVTWER